MVCELSYAPSTGLLCLLAEEQGKVQVAPMHSFASCSQIHTKCEIASWVQGPTSQGRHIVSFCSYTSCGYCTSAAKGASIAAL